ncbi:MAG: hypothetical protein ACJ8AI_32900 [Rhodopila sp.]
MTQKRTLDNARAATLLLPPPAHAVGVAGASAWRVLIAEYGFDTPVRVATVNLNADYLRRNSPNWAERCDIFYPADEA